MELRRVLDEAASLVESCASEDIVIRVEADVWLDSEIISKDEVAVDVTDQD